VPTPITVTEAAAVMGVSRARVLVLIKQGRIPAEKIGMQFLLQRRDLAKVKALPPGRPRKK
jgi:excisionase family DNA binding protein